MEIGDTKMKLGIVGLPNVGKSTLFNALTNAGAESANYPFCTIEPNVGIVPVPDKRLDVLAEMYKPEKLTPAVCEFVDIAGLVKGASKGEGLGNQFLSNIRECDAILHIIRCFENDDIIHVEGSIDPMRDLETINMELILSDMEMMERRIERTTKAMRADKSLAAQMEVFKVTHGVNAALNVNDVVVFKATNDVQNRITFADVGKELVTQTLALGCALHEAGDVDELDDGGGGLLGGVEIAQPLQTLIGHGNHTHIGVDGAESIVVGGNTGVGDGIEQSGLANVGQSDDT